MTYFFRATLWLCCVFVAASVAIAADTSGAPADATKGPDALAVKKQLETKFPGAEIRNVTKSPYFGLFEAQFDDKIVYTDSKVDYVMVGMVFDANSKTNLTEDRLRKLNRIAVNALPLNLAFKRVKGDGSRTLYIFSDADCPFCHRLETELQAIDNVTIYTFLYPIDQLHPDAARKSAMIWCAPDKVKAWDTFFASGKLPDNKGDCATPIAQTRQLGEKYKVYATPTLVFADGSVIPGALPAKQIETELATAEVEAKKIAAAKK